MGESRGGPGGGVHTIATYVAFLEQVGVIPAVVKQSFPCVPHITKKAEVDIRVSSRTFKFPCAYGNAIPGHWQRERERGTPLAICLVLMPKLLHPHRLLYWDDFIP